MTFLQLFFWVMPIVATCSYLLLLIIFLISKRDKAMKFYTLLLGAFVVWSGSSLLMRVQLQPGVLFWSRASLCGLFLTPLCVYYLVNCYIEHSNRTADMFWNAAITFTLIINCIGMVVDKAQIVKSFDANGNYVYSFNYTLGPLAMISCLIVTALVMSIFLRAYHYCKQKEVHLNKIQPVLIAIGITFIGGFCNMLPDLGQYPIDILCCTIGAFIMCYAIFKHRMFELRFLITRGMIFAGLSILIVASYITSIFMMQKYFNFWGKNSCLFISLAALTAALLLQPLFMLSHALVNRLFYKTSFRQRNALRTFNFNIANNINLGDLSVQLLKAVEQGISAKNSCLLLQNSETGSYRVFSSTMHLTAMDLEIGEHSPMVHWINHNGDCLVVDSFHYNAKFKALWEKEHRTLIRWDVQVIVPVKCRGVLIGIILLTSKKDGTSYTVEDLSLLKAFGDSTAIAIDNAHVYRRAHHQSITDDLTELYNTHYLYQYLPTVINAKFKSPVSVIIIDVDLFRVYNELYGHFEGDKALRRIASLIKTTVGQYGVCSRYGGEEFAIVLPNFNNESAYKIAENIRTRVQQIFFGSTHNDKRFLTVSIGICSYPSAAPNQDELMMRADLALFAAKNSGKNKTIIYTPKLHSKNKKSGKEYCEIEPVCLNSGSDMPSMQNSTGYTATLYALTAAIDTKDHFTFSHSQNVARYASALAAKLGMDPTHVEIIFEAGLLHDVGKIGIAEQILAKPDLLTQQEYDIMKHHVEMSITIVKHLPSLKYVIPAIMGHHERWDGKGYPRGLMGDQIPISARCLTIADSFDAIVSKRPYKDSLTIEFASKEIESCAGTHFDPQIATTFVAMVRNGEIGVSKNDAAPPISLNSDVV